MRSQPIDPGIQAMLHEARLLPECAAREALLEQAAQRAESLDDLDTAWEARCTILSSSAAHSAPRFENLFMTLAWCLAVSDRDPDRFEPSNILWQYKWVAEAAPQYAAVPRSVLERLVEDLEARYVQQGWGRRAGMHKRLELHATLGEAEQARELAPQWRRIPRDRGSDCLACEASFMATLLISLGDEEDGVREARQIIAGRLRCATVPHTTFGALLRPLVRLGRLTQARDLYDRGRRLVAAMDAGRADVAAPYITFAAFVGEVDHALAMLRARLPQKSTLTSDTQIVSGMGHFAAAFTFLHRRGVVELELPRVAGLVAEPSIAADVLADRCRQIAARHARALDERNGNGFWTRQLDSICSGWGPMPGEDSSLSSR